MIEKPLALQIIQGSIGAAIFDNDDLIRFPDLPEQSGYALSQHDLTIVGHDDGANGCHTVTQKTGPAALSTFILDRGPRRQKKVDGHFR